MSSLETPQAAARQLGPDDPLWAWAEEAIVNRAHTMLQHVEGVRLGEDIEAVHDMRVGSRRLVAAMKVFGECFSGETWNALVKEARQVTRRLGAVRDLDVLIDFYEKRRAEASPDETPGIDYLLALRRRQREKARRPMLASLDSLAGSCYPERVTAFLHREELHYRYPEDAPRKHEAPPICSGSFRDAAPPLLRARLQELYDFEQYAGRQEAVEELHEMRIKAKWLRYTMELFAPAYADDLKSSISSVKKIQERLGDLHDSDVRIQMLDEVLGEPLQARTLESIGVMLPDPVERSLARLREQEGLARQEYYRAFYKDWSKLEKARFREQTEERISRPDAGA